MGLPEYSHGFDAPLDPADVTDAMIEQFDRQDAGIFASAFSPARRSPRFAPSVRQSHVADQYAVDLDDDAALLEEVMRNG